MLLEEEVQSLKAQSKQQDVTEAYQEAWKACSNDFIWLPSQDCYGKSSTASIADRVQSLKDRHQSVRSEMEREARRVRKLEDKVKIICAGHWSRHASLQSSIHSSWMALRQESIDLESYSRLKAAEDVYAPVRLTEMKEMVQQQRDIEKQLQSEYKALVEEENKLKQQLEGKE